MPDRKNSKASDYVVGYRRPPKETRFTAGKSGNPKGRPKGSRSVGALLQDIIRQKISVTENGKTRRMSAIEVTLRRLANDAMWSDARAMKLLLSLVDLRGFWSEVQQVYEKRICTSLPSSLRIAWNGVLKPKHFLGVRLSISDDRSLERWRRSNGPGPSTNRSVLFRHPTNANSIASQRSLRS